MSQAQTRKSKHRKTVTALTYLLFFMFPVMILGGIGLTYDSAVSHNTAHPRVISDAQNGNITSGLLEAIPGISFIVLGYFGIFMMLIKIPAREVAAQQNAPVFKISLPVWWLIKNKGTFSKIDNIA